MLSLNQLPPEVLHVIFYYLDIPDILRTRRVSRYFNAIGRNRRIWTNAYRTAKFVHPPGPFVWQSTCDLEKTLVCGFRVDWNLRNRSGLAGTKKPILKRREIWCTRNITGISLVFGQFLIVGSHKEVQCYDLDLEVSDSTPDASIIYQSPYGMVIMFHCFSAIDIEGRPFACLVLLEDTATTQRFSIWSLRVEEQSKVTLEFLHQFFAPFRFDESVNLGPRVLVFQNETGHRVVAIDVHTRTEFLIPPIHAVMEAADIAESVVPGTAPTSISTSTHVILAFSCLSDDRWRTFFQAFALPPSNTHCRATTSISLSPSHNGVVFDIQVRDNAPLHDAIVESSTQDVLIAVQVQPYAPASRSLTQGHGILRLATDGTITFQLLGPLGQIPRVCTVHPSFHGMGRAFKLEVTDSDGYISAFDYDLRTGCDDGEAKFAEYPRIMRFSPFHMIFDYDPYSGRICVGQCLYPAKHSIIEIVDLDVCLEGQGGMTKCK